MTIKTKAMQQTYIIENSLTENFINQCRATILSRGRHVPQPLQYRMAIDNKNGFVEFLLSTKKEDVLKTFRETWNKFLTSKDENELAMFKAYNKLNSK